MQREVITGSKAKVAKEIWNANATDLETRLLDLEATLIHEDVPPASTTVEGVARLATQDTVDAGIEPSEIVTPATLAPRLELREALENRNQPSGYLGLNAGGTADATRLGTGPGGGKFLRDDGTYQAVSVSTLPDASDASKGVVLADKAPVAPASPIMVGRNSSIWETYIEGLQLQWTSPGTNGTHISATAGAAWIPGLNKVIDVPSTITGPNMAFVDNFIHYVYLYDSGGTPALSIELLPPAVYKGTACTHSSDSAKRYLGAFRTNSVNRAYAFQMSKDGDIFYKEHQVNGAAPFSLADGTAVPATGVSVVLGTSGTSPKNIVPPTSRLAWISFYILSGTTYLATSDDGLGDTSGTGRAVQGAAHCLHAVPLNASQGFIWSGGTVYAYLSGYRDQR